MTVAVKNDTRSMTPTAKQPVQGAEGTRPGPVFTPDVDIFESDAAITLLADLPGVKPEGLTIDLKEGVLAIDAAVAPDRVEGGQRLLREYEVGSFRREFRLSNKIDQTGIDAQLKDGVLRLTLPKAEALRPRKIEVRAG